MSRFNSVIFLIALLSIITIYATSNPVYNTEVDFVNSDHNNEVELYDTSFIEAEEEAEVNDEIEMDLENEDEVEQEEEDEMDSTQVSLIEVDADDLAFNFASSFIETSIESVKYNIEQDQILADCNGCTDNPEKPSVGKNKNGGACDCKAAIEARKRNYIRSLTETTMDRVIKEQLKLAAPILYSRLVNITDLAGIKNEVYKYLKSQIGDVAPGQTIDTDRLKKVVMTVGITAAEKVLNNIGIDTIPDKNTKNIQVGIEKAKEIINTAIDASLQAVEKVIQVPVDELPVDKSAIANKTMKEKAKKPVVVKKNEIVSNTTTVLNNSTKILNNTTQPINNGTKLNTITAKFNSSFISNSEEPVQIQAMAGTLNANQGVTEQEKALSIIKWRNLASVAPQTQKLWNVYQDASGDNYYVNTITLETTWRPPSPEEANKLARDFDVDKDAPTSWYIWKDNHIVDNTPVSKPRDWCNPYLCKNLRPCSDGKCQCGLMWEGDMCETPSKLAISIKLNSQAVKQKKNSLAEIESTKEKAQEKEDLSKRNATTEFMPVKAEIKGDDTFLQSVLNEEGKVDPTIVIKGPTNTVDMMPDLHVITNDVSRYYDSEADVNRVLTDPKSIKEGKLLNKQVKGINEATKTILQNDLTLPKLRSLKKYARNQKKSKVLESIKFADTISKKLKPYTKDTYNITSLQ